MAVNLLIFISRSLFNFTVGIKIVLSYSYYETLRHHHFILLFHCSLLPCILLFILLSLHWNQIPNVI